MNAEIKQRIDVMIGTDKRASRAYNKHQEAQKDRTQAQSELIFSLVKNNIIEEKQNCTVALNDSLLNVEYNYNTNKYNVWIKPIVNLNKEVKK